MHSSKRSAGAVGDQEFLKVLFQGKDRGVFDGVVLPDERLMRCIQLGQLPANARLRIEQLRRSYTQSATLHV